MIYLRILPEHLKAQDTPMTFNLIFRNKNDGKKYLACSKGDILDEQRLSQISARDDKGENLVLRISDLEAFVETFGHEQEVQNLNHEQIKLKKLSDERLSLLEMYRSNEPFNFLKYIQDVDTLEDFKTMVESAKIEIDAFSLSKSEEHSTLINFVSFALSRLGELSAGVAFCYFLTNRLNIKEESTILELLTAYALRELGYGYLYPGQNRNEDPDYDKYPMFTHHVLNLSKGLSNKSISRIILEHRENINGSGFPRGKSEQQTHFNSYIIGACHELFDIFVNQQKGKDFSKALGLCSNNTNLHPELTSTFKSLRR
ncbi:MAG: hypothetical protein KC478_05445 [Bacteriovoracaceae bacterium]|nr:hypothetical protein [Bacteriovoracaceae bacterium]